MGPPGRRSATTRSRPARSPSRANAAPSACSPRSATNTDPGVDLARVVRHADRPTRLTRRHAGEQLPDRTVRVRDGGAGALRAFTAVRHLRRARRRTTSELEHAACRVCANGSRRRRLLEHEAVAVHASGQPTSVRVRSASRALRPRRSGIKPARAGRAPLRTSAATTGIGTAVAASARAARRGPAAAR